VIENPLLQFLFVMANIVITGGYAFVALKIVPKINITLLRTKIGGVGFFALCGATHLHMAYSSLFETDMSFGHMATSWLSLAIHLPQAIFVWMFVTGLYIEIGSWALGRATGEDGEGSAR
jgi:hypothetical protein